MFVMGISDIMFKQILLAFGSPLFQKPVGPPKKGELMDINDAYLTLLEIKSKLRKHWEDQKSNYHFQHTSFKARQFICLFEGQGNF